MNYEKFNSLSLSLSLLKNKIKQKKEKAVILLLSVLISVLFVSTITYGATTIGSNINTGGTLTVSGNATLGDNATDLIKSIGSFNASSTLQATGAARFYSTLQVDGLTTLGNASTTNLSSTGNFWLNGNATTTSTGNIQGQGILTMLGTGTSTYSGGLQGTALNITSTTASSTFANGIILSKGCFLMPDGTCAGAGGGSGTINSGTTGQLSYYAGSGTTLTATSSLFIHSNQNIGIGTTTPNWLLQAAGTRPFFTLSDTGAATDNKHWFLSSQGGNFYVGTSSDALNATSTYLTIANGGNIGIGTAAPNQPLTVQGGGIFNSATAGDYVSIDSGSVILNRNYGSVTLQGSGGYGVIQLATNNSINPALQFAPGDGGGYDTNLYRSAANTLKTDDTLVVAGTALQVTGAGPHYFNTGNIGIGTTTPFWNMQIASSTKTFFTLSDMSVTANQKHWFLSSQGGNFYIGTSSDAYATSTSNLLNLISSNYSVGIGTTSPTEQLSVSGRLFVGGTGTSTIQNNLYVMGTLRSTVSYVGDLIFSNNFRFIESQPNEKTQSLFLNNQYGENIFKINEKGELIVREIESQKIKTKELQIGSSQNRTGITIYDKKTGKPYCLEINDGRVINKEGECK